MARSWMRMSRAATVLSLCGYMRIGGRVVLDGLESSRRSNKPIVPVKGRIYDIYEASLARGNIAPVHRATLEKMAQRRRQRQKMLDDMEC
eukprot:COSAG06_NODE_11216_length_1543_cov_2.477147_1_plen_90_part_00